MILEQTTVSIHGIDGLSSKQNHVLNFLYAPLIKSKGLRLYHLLISMNDLVLSVDYKMISESMNCTLDELEYARQECEKFLLIKTYASTTHHQIELVAPKTSHDFFAHDLLGRLFLQEFGPDRVKYINSIIRENTKPKESYEDISQPIHLSHLRNYNESLETVYQNEIHDLTNDAFDMKIFLTNSSEVTFPKRLHTQENQRVIQNLADTYRLSNDQMRIEVAKALNSTGTNLDLNKLTKGVSERLIPITSSDTNPLNWPTSEFLQMRMGPVAINESVFDAIDYIRQKYRWSDKILNVIVDYVIEKRKAIFTRNSLDQISNSLQLKQVKTQQQAINHFAFEKPLYKAKRSSKPVIKRQDVPKTKEDAPDIDKQKEELKKVLEGWK